MQGKNKLFLNDLLNSSQLTRAELSRITGVSTRQISNWNNGEVPKWAITYLELRAENIILKKENLELKEKIIKLLDKI